MPALTQKDLERVAKIKQHAQFKINVHTSVTDLSPSEILWLVEKVEEFMAEKKKEVEQLAFWSFGKHE